MYQTKVVILCDNKYEIYNSHFEQNLSDSKNLVIIMISSMLVFLDVETTGF